MAVELKRLLKKINEDHTICIILLVNFETPPYIEGYHEYEKIWTPFVENILIGILKQQLDVMK